VILSTAKVNKLAALITSGLLGIYRVNYRLLPGGLVETSLVIILCAFDL
jgi:hypothetical protein